MRDILCRKGRGVLIQLLIAALCLGSASIHASNPPQGRLVASFSYNTEGLRIEKRGERGIERYTYDDQSVLSQRDGSNALVARYTYGPNRLISLKHKSEGTQFYLTDALNSIVDLMTTDGLVQARYQYDAFGNKRSESGTSWNRFAFTGYEEDKETNLLYAKARYYDADTGRFLSQDAWHGENNTPPSLHKYLYSYQNPTVYVDRSGNFVTLAGGALGAAYGTGQAVGRAIYDASNGDLQSLGHYSSIVAQNAVGGAELGLSIDSLALSGGMALPVSSALGMAGGGALTLDGTPKDLNTFAKDQGRDGAIGFVAGPILAKAAPIVAKIPGVEKTVNYVGNKIGGAVEKVASKYEVGALDKALGVKPPPSPPVGSTINAESSGTVGGSQVPGGLPVVDDAENVILHSVPEQQPAKDVFHRRFSSSQSVEDMDAISSSGELWGNAPQGSDFPSVQAFRGALQDGHYGFEFNTPVSLPSGANPRPQNIVNWPNTASGVETFTHPSTGVEMAKIPIDVLKVKLPPEVK